MSQLSALFSALTNGQQAPTGGVGAPQLPYAPGMRFAAPAQVATPGQMQVFNRDSANYAEQARLQAEDEANMARIASQRGGAVAPQAAAQQQGGVIGGYNRLLDALNPRQ